MAAYAFAYAHCNNPEEMDQVPHKLQEQASAQFQQFKSVMRANNDKPQDEVGQHMVKIQVIADGKPVDEYQEKCCCSRPF